jgi:hypothetical protein
LPGKIERLTVIKSLLTGDGRGEGWRRVPTPAFWLLTSGFRLLPLVRIAVFSAGKFFLSAVNTENSLVFHGF